MFFFSIFITKNTEPPTPGTEFSSMQQCEIYSARSWMIDTVDSCEDSPGHQSRIPGTWLLARIWSCVGRMSTVRRNQHTTSPSPSRANLASAEPIWQSIWNCKYFIFSNTRSEFRRWVSSKHFVDTVSWTSNAGVSQKIRIHVLPGLRCQIGLCMQINVCNIHQWSSWSHL